MEALRASYGDTSSDSESGSDPLPQSSSNSKPTQSSVTPLPPPPISLFSPPGSLGAFNYLQSGQASRVRSFDHVDGNYALHVYIPVLMPPAPKEKFAQFLKKVASLVPGLHVVDVDIPLNNLVENDKMIEEVALGREFHISLGRTVPIRVHQINSVVTMLRQKLQLQRRYLINFNRWEIFVNDDHTRSFLSIEVITGGLAEITKQIQAVNEVYKLHSLPEFYKDPRPHISIAWTLGDISDSLKRVVELEWKRCFSARESSKKYLFTNNFSGIECKIGKKTYTICK